MRTVVGRVDDDRLFGDAQLVQLVQQLAHVLVVLDHHVVVEGLPAPGLARHVFRRADAEMHPGGVDPDEERCVVVVGALDEILGCVHELDVTRFHAFTGQRAGVLDALFADATPPRMLGGIVFLRGPGVDNAARSKDILEVGKIRFGRIVHMLRLLFGVEVIEVAKELIEAVGGGQILVHVAEVGLPN